MRFRLPRVGIEVRDKPGTQLALPFGLVGLIGGGIVGSIDRNFGPAFGFALVTMLVAAAWGAIVTAVRRNTGSFPLGIVVFGTLVAGSINAFLLMLFFAGGEFLEFVPAVFVIPVVVGAIFAVPFVPALAHIVRLDARVGLARPSSVVDRAARRGPWAACFGWTGAAACVAAVAQRAHSQLAFVTVGGFALFAAFVVLVVDVRALHRVRAADPRFDLGVGLDVTVDDVQRDYRNAPQPILVTRGDPTIATRLLHDALGRDAAVCTVLTGAAIVSLFLPRGGARRLTLDVTSCPNFPCL